MSVELEDWSAARIAAAVNAGRLKAEEVAAEAFARIRRTDSKVKAFLSLMEEEALACARGVDARVASGRPAGRLAGVPVAVKDNILVEGQPATCGSKILEGFKAPYDAAVVERLRAEGAVIVGKTNLDEFAMGSSTEHSAFFPTRNPWDLERVPGGSSGGSAAAVAARMVPLALGSDTGGSIRQPAAFCGVAGLKPTYGRVSRYGLVAFASSLDQIGPLGLTVEDCALALSVIAGHDPKDSTCSKRPMELDLDFLEEGVRGMKIGLPKEYFIEGLAPEVEKGVQAAIKVFEKLGMQIQDVSLPHTSYGVATYYVIAPSEASANLARFDGVRYGFSTNRRGAPAAATRDLLEDYLKSRGGGFGSEVKRRIMLGTHALSSGYYEAYYGKAQRVRTLLVREFEEVFKQVDAILTPTAPTPAFRLGEKEGDPLQMYLGDVFTIPCNMAGHCGISLPCPGEGLPVGAQLMGKPFCERELLKIARNYEKEAPWKPRKPAMA
ncbi:MAG: aspartyl/glutamyl-tRNA amidotransferase subunit A [Elusimicrobia bacterium RIFCSPLOWO2_12_FULL_59_9]|nr:MAG: aspartyl/glutamyl-tRNA amidotransferase subunit A [Elusimicrobia bacterium RIFCSPLOWO2_12_FULL_59_9]